MKRNIIFFAALLFSIFTLIQCGKSSTGEDDILAKIDTTDGTITCNLFWDKTPVTVANFMGLAEGTLPFTDPKTGAKVSRPFYDGIAFHRVIPGFMIQAGDPLGTGLGGPGYTFRNEIDESLDFSKAGVLAMANAGPDTNGSQFFITSVPKPGLEGKYTIFGEVVQGLDVVGKIENGGNNKITITKITIVRKGKGSRFNATEIFANRKQNR